MRVWGCEGVRLSGCEGVRVYVDEGAPDVWGKGYHPPSKGKQILFLNRPHLFHKSELQYKSRN